MSGTARLIAPGSPLSDRELEILPLIAEGLCDKEIGAKLWISHDTVKTHNRHMFCRLGARNRAQAVAIAYQTGILRVPGLIGAV